MKIVTGPHKLLFPKLLTTGNLCGNETFWSQSKAGCDNNHLKFCARYRNYFHDGFLYFEQFCWLPLRGRLFGVVGRLGRVEDLVLAGALVVGGELLEGGGQARPLLPPSSSSYTLSILLLRNTYGSNGISKEDGFDFFSL
jgi:hypothetical protein